MIMSIAPRGPAAASYRHLSSLDQFRDACPPMRVRFRGAMRWLGDAMMRTFSSPRVRHAGSWPRFTRDGLL